MDPDLKQALEDELKRVEANGFDLRLYEKQTRGVDEITRIIRTQLFLEHVVINLLEEALPHPGEVNLKRLSFPMKVDLCVAMGVLDIEFRPAMNAVNDLRNKIAHNLAYVVSVADTKRIFGALPEKARKFILDYDRRHKNSEPSSETIFTLIIHNVDLHHQDIRKQQLRQKYSVQWWERVLERSKEQMRDLGQRSGSASES